MAAIDPKELTARWKGTLGETLGIRITEATPDRVVASWT